MSRPCRMPDCRTPVGAASGGRYGLCKQCADRVVGSYFAQGRDLLVDYVERGDREWRKPVTLPPDAERVCATLGHWPDDASSKHEIAMAKRVCAGCPSRTACLEVALTNREPSGIWGGQTTRERNQTTANRAVAEAWTAIGQTEPGNWLACKHCGRQFDTPAARGVHESHEHSAAHNEEEPMPELDQRPEVPGVRNPHEGPHQAGRSRVTCVAMGCDRPARHSQLCGTHLMARTRGQDIPVLLAIDGPTPCRENKAVFGDEARWDAAKALCHVCPSMGVCRQLALDTRQRFDVWGGMTPAERFARLARTEAGHRAEYRRRFGGWTVPDGAQQGRHAAVSA